jgi:hypothetical protein
VLGGHASEAVAAAGHGDDVGAGKEAVEDGAGGGHVAEEFSPVLDGAIGGHEGGAGLVPAKDDLEEDLAAFGWEFLEAHVVNDEQFWLEVTGEEAVFFGGADFGAQVAHEVEDAAVVHAQTGANGLQAEGLGEVAFTDARGADEKDVTGVADPLAGGQLGDSGTGDVGIEAEVEIGQAAGVAEGGQLGAALDLAAGAHIQLVLEKQFEELLMRQTVADRFLKAYFQTEDQPAEAQGMGLGFEVTQCVHGAWLLL